MTWYLVKLKGNFILPFPYAEKFMVFMVLFTYCANNVICGFVVQEICWQLALSALDLYLQ
jgi:hypothetical protein